MELHVIRYSSAEDSTLGLFLIDNKFACYTLEDEARAIKVSGETRIPAGRYRVRLRKEGGHHQKYGQMFPDMHKGMLHITNVPNFTWILIHIGNTDEDTAGCLLVGDATNNNQIKDAFIQNSKNAYIRIYKPIADAIEQGEEVWINYLDNIPLTQTENTNGSAALVTAEHLNIRKRPSGSRLGVLLEGTPTEIKNTVNGWHNIVVEGWVSAEYLKRT